VQETNDPALPWLSIHHSLPQNLSPSPSSFHQTNCLHTNYWQNRHNPDDPPRSRWCTEIDFLQAREGVELVDEIQGKLSSGYIRVRQILVATQEQADQIHARLEGGESFLQLALEHNQGSAARFGGDLGLIKRGDLIPTLEEAMFALSIGQYSGVVASPAGFHIFMREE